MYPTIGPCSHCGNDKAERHHRDGNTANNEPSNIDITCRRCHMSTDGRLTTFRILGQINLPNAVAKAARARKSRTHCPKGHPYSGKNLYINPRGARCCRECLNAYKRAKRKAVAP